MTLITGPNLGQLVHGDPGEEHYAHLIKQWRALDALVQARVKSASTTTPPAAPVDGDCYIVPAGATGAWAGHMTSIARWSALLKEWEFYIPQPGWMVWVSDAQGRYQFGGAAWGVVPIDGEWLQAIADIAAQVPDGRVYASVAEGVEAVGDDQQFWVRQVAPRDGRDLYRRTGAVAVYEGVSMAGGEEVERIANVAGSELSLELDDIRIVCDELGHMVMRLRGDGTQELLGLRVANYEIQQSDDGSAKASGELIFEDVVSTKAVQLYGEYADAVRVVCDEAGHVIYVEWPDGRIQSTEGGSGSTLPGARYIGLWVMPDSVPGRMPPGFTCTGLDRITRGAFSRCWVVGDDGRLADSGSSPYVPRIHIMDPECRRILATIDPGYSGASLQGVAVDTSGAADTLWVATARNDRIIHLALDGSEISGDVIDWVYTSRPNGVAYDPVNHAVWVTPISGNTARLIACDPNISPRVIREVSLANTSPDQLHYDSERELLYYSTGGNGANGTVRVYRLADDVDVPVYSAIPYAQAIEGIFIDRDTGTLYVANDAGFHVSGRPQLNCMLRYAVPLIN